jgi:hypothetical protein
LKTIFLKLSSLTDLPVIPSFPLISINSKLQKLLLHWVSENFLFSFFLPSFLSFFLSFSLSLSLLSSFLPLSLSLSLSFFVSFFLSFFFWLFEIGFFFLWVALAILELCRPGWPLTHRDSPASASRVLGLKA